MEAIIFIGIQGSGKTTFYKERFFNSHMRINLDMLRTRHREKILFKACIDSKAKVVVDNTNTLMAEREIYIKPAKEGKFRVIGYFFIPDVEGSLHRNATRTESPAVPEVGLLGKLKQLERPKLDEGFDELYYVEINKRGEFEIRKSDNEI